MSVQELNSTKTGLSTESQATQLQKWFTYIFCAAIGMVSGAMGIALTIGLMIILVQMSTIVVDPNSYVLISVAVLFGLGFSWLLERLVRFVMPGLNMSQRHQQVVFVFGVLTVLLEGVIFAIANGDESSDKYLNIDRF